MKFTSLINRSDTFHQSSINEEALTFNDAFTFADLQANFAFGLWSNDFSKIHNFDDIKDYVQLNAILISYDFTQGDFSTKQEKLELRPCTESDEFFDPIEYQTGTASTLKQFGYCLPDSQDIEIYGNGYVQKAQMLMVKLVRCRNEIGTNSTCKTDAEIDEFIDKNGHFYWIQNN